ncbi:MAG: ABC transporter ATP-binding protein [Ruminococcaceae bacterium]|nr:ABC transporter ATP-binding protein [Oscillospiraceae bacterium]
MKKENSSKRTAIKDRYSAYRDSRRSEKERPKKMLPTAGKLIALLKGREVAIIFTVLCAAGASLLTILGPRYLGSIIDVLNEQVQHKLSTGSMNFEPVYGILKTILLIYIGSSVLSFLQHYIIAGVVQRLITDIRYRFNKKLSRLPLSYFDNHNTGDILSRITNDIDNINNTLQNNLIQVITSVVTFAGVFAIMMTESVSLSITSLSPFPVCFVIAMVILRFSKHYFRKQWKETGDVNGHIEEMFTGHRIVKAFGHEETAIAEFDELNEKLCESSRRAQFLSGLLSPLINFANNAGYVIICVIGGYLILKEEATVGDITVFITYSKLLMQPITDLSNIANNLQSSLASAERVFDLLDAEEEVEDTEKELYLESGGSVEFRSVDFSYLPDKPLIKDFNLKVNKGDLVAIVGPTGAGKTTIVNLLMRFYEIQGGDILIDGVSIKDISRENLRNIFGMVLQDTWLFKGTLRDNIYYGRKDATGEEFENAVKAAKVDSFIGTLTDGYDTVIEEGGSNLSAGQRQLITIARAILASPDILILDEATSSVDTRTELQIQSATYNLMRGRTNFVIAHRLSTIREADTIIVMRDGSIVETGNHRELLKKDGFYAELYNSQFAN